MYDIEDFWMEHCCPKDGSEQLCNVEVPVANPEDEVIDIETRRKWRRAARAAK